jgi:hypothetical protein
MARPKFSVQHFIACLNAGWQGRPGPGAYRDLEGVSYAYFVPPGTEAPEFPELWVYARLFLTNGVTGGRTFSVEVARRTGNDDEVAFTTFAFDPVTFRTPGAVVNVAWPLRPVTFPSVGDYVLRLLCEVNTWGGPDWRVVAREFIRIEYQR